MAVDKIDGYTKDDDLKNYLHDVKLNIDDFISSLNKGIFGIPFQNGAGETVYPCKTERIGRNILLIEMEDGSNFKITIVER